MNARIHLWWYNESILVQAMAWCHHASWHYLRQCWTKIYVITWRLWATKSYTKSATCYKDLKFFAACQIFITFIDKENFFHISRKPLIVMVTQYINGLVQERCNSIAYALEYIFLVLTHWYDAIIFFPKKFPIKYLYAEHWLLPLVRSICYPLANLLVYMHLCLDSINEMFYFGCPAILDLYTMSHSTM